VNFIFISSDTLRRDHLGCYGNAWISTPHIDAFAAQALRFLNAYAASFPTVPNRRDVLTGRYTASYTGWAPLRSNEVVLPQALKSGGFESMMVCDTPHILANGYNFDRGFDGWEWIRGQESDRWRTSPEAPRHPCDPVKLRNPDMLATHHRRNVAWWHHEADCFVARTMATACSWLEENYGRERFFLYVDTFDPHEPWDPPDWYVQMYDPDYNGQVVDYPCYAYADFLTEAELKHARALYAAEVTLVDRWIGRLLDKIADLGLLKDTVVILTTDHGFLHGEHGIMGKGLIDEQGFANIPLYEEISHIPLIVHYPGAGPGVRKAMVQPMDIMATILDIARIEMPDTVHGRSFAGVLRGEGDRLRDFAVTSPYLGVASGAATVTCGKWSAIIWSAPEQQAAPDKAVDGFAKAQRTAADAAGDMLFDLGSDPGQQHDIAAAHPQVLADLRARAVGFWAEVGTDEALLARWRACR
jgi:arylsulfatase A-like enzyme